MRCWRCTIALVWSLRSTRAWFVAGLLTFVAASALGDSRANAAQDLNVAPNIEFIGDPLDAVDIELGPGDGYYVLDRVGRVHTFGNVTYFGGSPLMADGEMAVSMSMTPDNDGYWVFTNHGRVFAYGAAEFFGDVSSLDLVGPVLDSVATRTGLGYYMLADDGGIFAFGDAEFFGSIPGLFPNSELAGRIVSIAPTDTGNGYWLAGEDGGIFGFGDAEFLGSVPSVVPPGTVLDAPVVAMIAQANGYLLVGADGGIFNFGTSPFHGSIPGFQARSNFRPGVGIAAVASPPDGTGYLMIDQDGTPWPFGDMIVLGQPELTVLLFPPVGVGGLRPPSYFAVVPRDPGDARDCADFLGQGDAQRWFDAYSPFFGDPADLDVDANGRACETLAPGSLAPSTFDPGVQQVGLDIASGTYRALEADASCNWTRGRENSPFQVGDFSGDRLVVSIVVTDATFESSPGCGVWSSDLSAITPSQTADVETPGGRFATLIVGVDIAPGLWRLESENEPDRATRIVRFHHSHSRFSLAWQRHTTHRHSSTDAGSNPSDRCRYSHERVFAPHEQSRASDCIDGCSVRLRSLHRGY